MIRSLLNLVRGLTTAAVLLAVIAGAPWALLRFFGPPVPTAVPSMQTVREWFDTPNTSEHLLAVVLLIVWAGWAAFTYIIGTEVVAAVRGVRTRRIRLATPLHAVAAGLVGATATALSSTAAHATPPAPPPTAPVAGVPDHAAATTPGQTTPGHQLPAAPITLDTAAAAAPPSPTAPATAQPRYQVVRDDWLSGIADRFLGDPHAYPRLAELNPNLEHRDPRFPDHIEPGWIVLLPADAVDRGPTNHATGTLLTPPDPGPDQPPPIPDPVPPPTPPGPTEPTVPPGTSETPAAPTVRPSDPATNPRPAPAPDPTATDQDEDDDVVLGGSRNGVLAGAALLATLALQVLEADRRWQRRHRRPGQRLPNPRGGATERDLRIAEAPADVQRLDLALRHLTAALADQPSPPDILGVRLAAGEVQLLLAGHAPSPPLLWLDEGDHWLLPATTPLPDLAVIDRPVPTLTAIGSRAGRHLLLDLERHGSLTITGHPDRAAALLRYMVCELATNAWSEDAEIIITGFPEHEADLLKQVRPHRVILAASVADAAAQLSRHIHAIRRALDALELADTLHGRLRGIAVDAWTPRVLLVHHPDPHDQATLAKLHQDLIAAGRCGAALVVATTAGHIGDTVATIGPDATLTVTTPHLRATTTAAAALSVRDLQRLAEILRLALVTDLPTDDEQDLHAQPQPTAIEPAGLDPGDVVRNPYDPQQWASPPAPATGGGATAATPGAPAPALSRPRPARAGDETTLDADLAAWVAADTDRPRIAILGRIAIDARGPAPERRWALHAEIAVYLAAHPRGASIDQLIDAIWPHGIHAATARGLLAAVRRWLGATPDGSPWLPDAREARLYRIEPGYLLDWHLLTQLRARARRRGGAGVEDLRTALSLVRGQPLAGAHNPNFGRDQYTWLSESAINPPHILAAIIDTAHHLAQHHLDQGDTAGARWAIQQAWTADPDRIDDQPWLDLMRAEHIDGNRAELRQLRDQLVSTRGHEVPEDLPTPTFNAIEDLFRE